MRNTKLLFLYVGGCPVIWVYGDENDDDAAKVALEKDTSEGFIRPVYRTYPCVIYVKESRRAKLGQIQEEGLQNASQDSTKRGGGSCNNVLFLRVKNTNF